MNALGDGYVHLFNPNSSTFEYSFLIPTSGAGPWDVEVTPHVNGSAYDVWFTLSGIDAIGRLVYTDTLSHRYTEYAVSDGCSPRSLDVREGFVWFTEPGCNQLGRLNISTGAIAEFAINTPDSYPADLFVDTDGSVWFTEMQADQIGHLVVTSTVSYAIHEYQGPTMPDGSPYGIVKSGDRIYITQYDKDRVTVYEPDEDQWVDISPPASGVDEPYNLTVDGAGRIWATEHGGNRISQFGTGTFPIVNPYEVGPADSIPMDLDADSSNRLWFTQWAVGQIGRLAPSNGERVYFTVPGYRPTPTGITLDDEGRLWVLSSAAYRVYIPLIMASGG
ncbi:MAG: virginiamycin B lyase family protein [Anaerolineae bacterium]